MPTRAILHDTAIMISDLHVGDPTASRLDDFTADEPFERLLDVVIPEAVGVGKATLVLGGDFIDFPQAIPEYGKLSPEPRLGTTEVESRARLRRVLDGHPRVFAALGRFLAAGHQVLVLPGNHDIDLHWDGVFDDLRAAVGGAPEPQLQFVRAGHIQERGVHLEHGNQYAFDNRFEFWSDPCRPNPPGPPRIERPWGTWFMDVAYNDIEWAYPFVNKVQPDAQLAAIAVRLLWEQGVVAVRVIAPLAAFLMRNGWRFGAERLLGAEEAPTSVTQADLDAFGAALGGAPARRSELLSAMRAELGQHLDAGSTPTTAPDVLGRTDERGMEKRARALFQSGEAVLVGFGHIHEAIDAKPLLGRGQPERFFNTGSWMPAIHVRGLSTPSVQQLEELPRIHELRYLVISWSAEGYPTGTLRSLPFHAPPVSP